MISLYLLFSLTLSNLKNAITSIKAYPPAIIYPRVVRQAATEKVSHRFNNGAERNKDAENIEECYCWEWQVELTQNNSRSDLFLFMLLQNVVKLSQSII